MTSGAPAARTGTWGPFGTIGRTLWIGGAQWAGKSTVGNLIADRHRVTCYHYDYTDARGHWDRSVAAEVAAGRSAPAFDPEAVFVSSTVEDMVEYVLRTFRTRFPFVLDDLRALVSGGPIVAEGWGLRPELVVEVAPSIEQMVLLVPTDDFRRHQVATLERAQRLSFDLSDPTRAQRNRLDRDRLVAADAVARARLFGVRVIEVDGTIGTDAIADLVADHFARYLA